MSNSPDYEIQLAAMRTVMEALQPLDPAGREAVLAWVGTQFGLNKEASPRGAANPAVTAKVATRDGTVSVVAQRLGAKSARDLLLAAAVHLSLHEGKDSFTRAELVARAKDARGWKANYAPQVSIHLKRMFDAGVLFEKARDVFSLSDEALKDAEGKLAQ